MTPAQKAFEEWINHEIRLPVLGKVREMLILAWKARGEFDAKICDRRKFKIQLCDWEETYNESSHDCAEAIRKADL